MGYMTLIAPCILCGEMFGCNPDLVPSIRVNGQREPVCGGCMKSINQLRRNKGVEPLAIHPLAYESQEIN
jgi:hypothetical protein